MTQTTNPTLDGTSAFTSPESLNAKADSTGEGLLAQRNEPVEWIKMCISNIRQLRELPPNWDSYGAYSVDPNSIRLALEIIIELSSVTGVGCPRIAASPAGNVALSWDLNNCSRELDLEVDPSIGIRYAYIDDEDSSQDREGETQDLNVIAQFLTQW